MTEGDLLKIENMTAGYGHKIVTREVSFSVGYGEIVSLIGPNGSGKTTILKTVSNFMEPMDGTVRLDGRNIHEIHRDELSKAMAVMMTERMSTEQMTVKDVVSMGRYPYTGLLGRLSKDDEDFIREALYRVGLADLPENIFNSLSDGQKQRALLARAICQEPRLMILDEPTSYLDIYHKLRFIDILKELVGEKNISVLMSVHELEIAYEVSTKVICLGDDGRVKFKGTPQEVFSEKNIEALYGLDSGRLNSMYGRFIETIRDSE